VEELVSPPRAELAEAGSRTANDQQKGTAMIGLIISLIVVGLIAGALARLIVPGRQHMSILATIVLGVVGSLIGGFLGYVLFHKDAGSGLLQPSGIIGSVIGAVIALLVYVYAGRSHRVHA
jgi:uncharacterized membrane protein YeaQ/YmgE (transglycosylase-associated protein family)